MMSSTSAHGTPTAGSSCMCCWEDLTGENYIEYKSSIDSPWLPSGFCRDCINTLIQHQFDTYKKSLAETKCKAEQRRLLQQGPPINISDKTALVCPDGGEVYLLWQMIDGTERSAKLDGSLVGEVSYVLLY